MNLLRKIKEHFQIRRYICPICDYPHLDKAPLQYLDKTNKMRYSYIEGVSTFEICPSCGNEFGYDDHEKSWDILRKEWIKNGMRWFSKSTYPPTNWNPKIQLENVNKIAELNNHNRKKLTKTHN